MKYTKGEWKFRHPVNCDYTIYAGEYGEGITLVAQVQETHPNAEANAHLIAAAPELYEACKAVIARRMECHELEAAYIPSWIEAVYKAIAKAEDK